MKRNERQNFEPKEVLWLSSHCQISGVGFGTAKARKMASPLVKSILQKPLQPRLQRASSVKQATLHMDANTDGLGNVIYFRGNTMAIWSTYICLSASIAESPLVDGC